MDILKEIISSLEREERVMLATIISTSGSTPASALSKMMLKNDCSTMVGTVGGGCMEADVAEHAKIIFPDKAAKIVSYRLTEDGIEQGLICGGSLDILLEPLTKKNIPLIKQLRKLRDEGEDCVLATLLSDEGKRVDKAIISHPLRNLSLPASEDIQSVGLLSNKINDHDVNIEELVSKVYDRGETERESTKAGELILEPMPGKPSLVIFGGGHVSKFVSRTATMAGFGVTVVDDREMFANSQRFPESDKTVAAPYEEAFQHITIKPSTYIVIVTRGHRYDEVVLEQAVKTDAKYIGMIGSKRKVFTTYQHLVDRGISADALKKVFAPMGLDIGAITAEEIAVSIVSEIIKIRRGGKNMVHKSDAMKPLFYKLNKDQLITG